MAGAKHVWLRNTYVHHSVLIPDSSGIQFVGPRTSQLLERWIAPLEGITQTDWLPYTFTMNWVLTGV